MELKTTAPQIQCDADSQLVFGCDAALWKFGTTTSREGRKEG